jgi:segregation and condensation protein A
MKKQASVARPVKSKRGAAPTATSETMMDGIVGEGAELHLQLPGFEGPFDLLLHLIEEHELDILDIPIAFVTERYLQYLALMQELNIDVASDYLVMAATLAHLKSRLLLPTPPADDDADGDDAEQDPRAELIRRLLEYQKYKQAAEQLANRSVLGRDTFARGPLPEIVEGPAPLAPVGVFKLLEAFQKILERAKTVVDHHIEFERLSITERINQLVDRLRQFGTLSFDALFEGQRTRAELIVTFLALLEMTRLRLTNVHQEHALAPIVIELAVTDGDQAIDSDAADYLAEARAHASHKAEKARGVATDAQEAAQSPADTDEGLGEALVSTDEQEAAQSLDDSEKGKAPVSATDEQEASDTDEGLGEALVSTDEQERTQRDGVRDGVTESELVEPTGVLEAPPTDPLSTVDPRLQSGDTESDDPEERAEVDSGESEKRSE